MKTTDLGNDWFANLDDDGSLTLRNGEIGQRVTIPAYSASLLYAAMRNLAKEQGGGPFDYPDGGTTATHGPEEAEAARRVGMID